MESTGVKGRIHFSRDTADQLIAHGKEDWIQRRMEKVVAKGKGVIETVFLNMTDCDTKSAGYSSVDMTETSFTNASFNQGQPMVISLSSEKISSLIKWNVEMLKRSLKLVVANRAEALSSSRGSFDNFDFDSSQGIPIDEVVEVIDLPSRTLPDDHVNRSTIALPPAVKRQLHDYVRNVAALYRTENAFHGFEVRFFWSFTHAVHKGMWRSLYVFAFEARESRGNVGCETLGSYC